MQKYDVVVIGAGIVGLCSAYQLKKKAPFLSIAVVEKEKKVGTQQTSHNSGVIHSGVYYPPGSSKAKNCLEGRKQLLRFCEENSISVKPLGKVIVATEEKDLPNLYEIEKRGKMSKVPGLSLIDPEELKEKEPYATGIKALWVPSSAIVEFNQVAEVLYKKLQKQGVTFFLEEKVKNIFSAEKDSLVQTTSQEIRASLMLNCAGIFSDQVANMVFPKLSLQIIPFRGEYYELSKEKNFLVKGLIYPVCDLRYPFLGIHFTPMMNGKVEVGPNAVLAFSKSRYVKGAFDIAQVLRMATFSGFWRMSLQNTKVGLSELFRSFYKKKFVEDAKKLIPSVEEKDLIPGLIGLRSQVVSKKGEILYDFCIKETENTLHVLNAPSPAATASFAIGEELAEKVLQKKDFFSKEKVYAFSK